ncbi:MAG TPA: EAL domain-containing protein [Anaerolineae bacterium]|nr:EAL domain-containing protein [Anaerolineae bacterium]
MHTPNSSLLKRLPVYHWSDLPQLASLALLYALLANVSLTYFLGNSVVAIVWLPSGLALAALLMGGRQYWPAVLIGAWIGSTVTGKSAWASISLALANTLEPVIGLWLLSQWFSERHSKHGFNPALTHPRDFLWLGLAAISSAGLSAVTGVSALFLAGFLTPQTVAYNLLRWWQGDTLGIMLLTPVILVWRRVPQGWLERERTVETVTCFGLAFWAGLVIFLGWFHEVLGNFAKGYLMLVFIVWSAVRFGQHGVLLVVLTMAVQALAGAALGVGYFGLDTEQTHLLNFGFYLVVMTGVGIALAWIIDERKRAEAALARENHKFKTLMQLASDGIHILDVDGNVLEVNDAFCRGLGYSAEVLHTMNVAQWDAQWSAEELKARIAELLKAGRVFETRHRRRDGQIIDVEINATAVEIDGMPMIYASSRDISERKQAEESLRLASLVFQNSSEAMTVTDADGAILSINPAFTEVTGYALDEVIGKNPKILNSGRQDEAFYRDMWREINTTGHWQGEIWNRRKNGEVYAEWLTINSTFNEDGSVHRRVALFSDITKMKESEDLIWQQANYDALTQLPNRRMFHDRLEQELKKAHRAAQSIALMFVDLDRFKEVNDTLGHGMGDILLKDTAQRLSSCVRESDTVARLGGDEFTLILGELDDPGIVERIAQDMLRKLAEPFQLRDEIAYISASIGITMYPDDATSIDELLKNADQAMYAAKQQGRNRHHYFTPSMQRAAQTRLRLANDLRAALTENQLRVVYQPIVELATGAIHKAEALIRWQHPTRGFISPAEFIPIAEDTGIIIDIGNWVFRQSAYQAAHWRTLHHPAFQISVNKSPVQFRNDRSSYKGWLDQLGDLSLPRQSIVIEITEGLLLNADAIVEDKLLKFRDAGMQVAIDDFGTGYSSLSYLKKFDIDYLKIDQSFVRNLAAHSDDLALCEAIVVMAHKLGVKVIAEGVETVEQRELLAAAGCDYAQGYLFSRPVPAEEFEQLF